MIRRLLVLAIGALASIVPVDLLHAEPNGTWSVLAPGGTGPTPRNQHGAAYDPINDQMIVFGGAEAIAETWAFELASLSWIPINNPPSPSGRKAMSMVFDPARHRVLSFGGYDGNYDNDVWALSLDGIPGWTKLFPGGIAPSGRMFTLAVYDPVRDRMIVFGGHPQTLNDVWSLTLSGTPQWTQITPAGTPPDPRYGHVGVYDPAGDRLIVFGGTSDDDTWALTLSGTPTWTKLVTVGTRPAPRQYSAAVYDSRRGRMVICGGTNLASPLDAWALSLDLTPTWTHLAPNGTAPSGRDLHTAVYQPSADRMIVFGGTNAGSEVDALTWGEVSVAPAISGFAPVGGRVGDEVHISGLALDNATEVRFNGVLASITQNTSSYIVTNVPPGATTGPISVTTAYGTVVSTSSFTVGDVPVISAATPAQGKIGATIVLTGIRFTGATRVAFGSSSSAQFVIDSDTQITATVDASAATGPISVTTPVGTGVSSFAFTLVPFDHSARIIRVRDVPNDQGGLVSVRWVRSDFDTPLQHEVTGYRVWRRAPNLSANAPGASSLRMAANSDTVYWEAMATIPAAFLDGYAYTAPTTQDSLPDSNPFTAFFVQTLTANTLVFYNSPPDSGYSVDNLAPPTPMPFAVTFGAQSNALHWGASRAADLREFRLYRGHDLGFVPGPLNLVVASRDTGYIDSPGEFVYKLVAVDVHGNASRAASVYPTAPVASLASLVSVDVQSDGISLVWYAGDNAGAGATLYRRTSEADWSMVGSLAPEGSGYFRYLDTDVSPGGRYGYRLGIVDGDQQVFVGEAWATVTGPELSLRGGVLNSNLGRYAVSLALTDAGPATLELVDVTGRLLSSQQLSSLGPGSHLVELEAAHPLSSGIYFLRLTQGGRQLNARVAIIK